MRKLCLLALLALTACDWFGSPAPPPATVPAIQTETAALHALATAKAEAFPPTRTPPPPATQTAIAATETANAGEIATIWAGATITTRAFNVESTATIAAVLTENVQVQATDTALVRQTQDAIATLTALSAP